jgi:hypothetical protein
MFLLSVEIWFPLLLSLDSWRNFNAHWCHANDLMQTVNYSVIKFVESSNPRFISGLLRTFSIWNKRKTYADNDYYDSDEDTFFDRTGQIEEQRRKRKMRLEVGSFSIADGE